MQSFTQFLAESQEINLARKAVRTLSSQAREAIEDWERSGWHTGALTGSFRAGSGVIEEISAAFEPIRQYMKRKHGTHITLYRGLQHGDYEGWKVGVLQSWTTDINVAKHFAGHVGYKRGGRWKQARPYALPPVSDAKVNEIIDNFNKRGFAKFGPHKYIISRTNPKYYNIYDRDNEMVTDGDTHRFADAVRKWQKERAEDHAKIQNRGKVITRSVLIDDIVWITNELDCKEFIVRRQPD